jgi:hypothetical protein
MKDDNERTLCECCVGIYYDAGYTAIKKRNQKIIHSCEICRKSGWEYVIKKIVKPNKDKR